MSRRFSVITCAMFFGALWAAQPASAQTATTTFPVTATVLTSCSVTANPLAFGSYNPTAATVTTRQMSNGTNRLNYALYQEAGRTTNWGNTPGTNTPAPTTAPIAASSLTVYGRVPAGQNVPAGNYTDTITVTVNY